MNAQRAVAWQRGLVLGSALGALVLLVVFYSVVSAAVDRAASRRAELDAVTRPRVVAAPPSRVKEAAPAFGKQLLARAPR